MDSESDKRLDDDISSIASNFDNEYIEISSDEEIEESKDDFEDVNEDIGKEGNEEFKEDGIVTVSLVNGEGVVEESDIEDSDSDSESEEDSDSDSDSEIEVFPYKYMLTLSGQVYEGACNRLESIQWGKVGEVGNYIKGSFYTGLKMIAIPVSFTILGYLAGSYSNSGSGETVTVETVNVCKTHIIHVIHHIYPY